MIDERERRVRLRRRVAPAYSVLLHTIQAAITRRTGDAVKRFGCLAALALSTTTGSAAAAPAPSAVRNVVLVHGAFADGSGWRPVAEILERDGFKVSVVQEPETSLPADVAATRLVLDQQQGRAVLVGHSYGGAVITAAGAHPKVASLVYVAGFAPDTGQSLMSLNKAFPSLGGKDIVPIGGFTYVKPERFPADFAACLPLPTARYMAISQVGQSVSSAMVRFTDPAWKHKPTFAIVAADDHMIAPELERKMYARAHADVTELKSCHAVYIAEPQAVAAVIEKAAQAAH